MALNKATERLFKYPPMERQDLNQSQLGSFKFTPVDPVSNIQTLTQSAKHYLEQQLSRRLPRGAAPLAAGSSQNKPNAFTDMSPEKSVPYSNPSSVDASFFNKHIKPDLGDSRLRLGPAALRSAVEGAASPTKSVSVTPVQQELDATLRQHQQTNSFNAPELVSSQPQVPLMDLKSAIFTLDGGLVGQSRSDSTSFTETLCVALANEQRAHNATKAALAEKIDRCILMESQIRRNRQQITSMTTTIKSLGAIVKHNANGSKGKPPVAWWYETDVSEDNDEVALREFYREYQKVKDAAKEKDQYKEEEQHTEEERPGTGVSAKKDTTGVVVAPSSDVVDDAELYNLDLLKKPTFDNSADSVLRRTLRKHFSIDDNADDGKPPMTPTRRRPSINRLIDISPESSGEAKEKDKTEREYDMGTPKKETLVDNSANDSQQRLNASTTNPSQVRLLTAQNPVLELPPAIVAKYGQRPVEPPAQALEEKAEVFLRKDTLSKPPSNDEHYGKFSPPSSIANDHNDPSATDIVSPIAAHSRSRITVQVGDNLHGEPKWLINKDNPIFESEQEKMQAIVECGNAWRQNSPFIHHPVRYLPEDAAGTADAYRTVMVDAIPVGSTIPDVLSIVKGGSLESIQLFPPIGKVTTVMTARIVFNYEESAHNMIKHQEARSGEAKDGNRFKINGLAVRCWMPTDPTYPRNDELERKVLGKPGASRIILLDNIDEYTYNLIPYKIKPPHAQHVIEYSYTLDGCVSIEFTDVKTAIMVMDMLRGDRDLWDAIFQYDTDYTCTPYVKGEPMGN
ncbi:hypothetical protein, variant 1 [Cladophialophora immunda]|uniref:Uncharacterized protein n=1 Tax=Cladophialophora immunda TaxID=569365 RepID=A0A0D1ZRG2_9EURO|nr:hypothetical protein, variant 1 [Cladophialophora immunda]KIW30631.1 hypothetical protein, variant 1 [Cladophialophora immunda]OQU99536.1 hypothetical protein CLAIMM_05156 isoform 6 [Cladophialophora immunda]